MDTFSQDFHFPYLYPVIHLFIYSKHETFIISIINGFKYSIFELRYFSKQQ